MYFFSLTELPNVSIDRFESALFLLFFQMTSKNKTLPNVFEMIFVQLRSKKEVEALLQGTLGNNNAYLEKKKYDVLRQTKIKLEKKATTYKDLTSLKKS